MGQQRNSGKLQKEFKESHIFQIESHHIARSSARLLYRLLHSDQLDQALKCLQRSISTAAFTFASGPCSGTQPQLSLKREALDRLEQQHLKHLSYRRHDIFSAYHLKAHSTGI